MSTKYSNGDFCFGLVHGTVQTTAVFPTFQDDLQVAGIGNTFRMLLAYDGTDFFGWQVQPGLRTIQGELAAAIKKLTGDEILPQGSGRTDTGVHAEGQVVSLRLHAAIPADRLHRALNRRLPAAIRVLAVQQVSPAFHARTHVLHKTYEYRIFERRRHGSAAEAVCQPPLARFVWDCRWPLHLQSMQATALQLVGEHDFTSFAASDLDRTHRLALLGTPVDNTRTIFHADWEQQDALLIFRICGSGFLHHMVRNIVGTCVDVGTGRIAAGAVPGILQRRDRRFAGATAPPQGLHLMQVVYQGDPQATAASGDAPA